jgi:hypothetical protein
MSIQLSDEQRQKIREYAVPYKKWVESDEARGWLDAEKERMESYKKLLHKDNIEKLTEEEIADLKRGLWSMKFWTSKEYALKQFFEKNDMNIFRRELKLLLWGEDSLQARYDRVREHVWGMGTSAITEILAFVHPTSCGIWNEKVRMASHLLVLDTLLPSNKYNISGEEYEHYNKVLGLIRDELNSEGLKDATIFGTHLFFYFIATRGKATEEYGQNEDYEFDHDEIIDKLVAIGEGLGFESSSEVTITKGARVDALWTAKIGNLGEIKYVFEVQKSGSVDSLILNLQRAKNNPTVQKLVVVGNTKTLNKVKEEVLSLGGDFSKSLAYMEAKDVMNGASLLLDLNTILSKLELVKPQF